MMVMMMVMIMIMIMIIMMIMIMTIVSVEQRPGWGGHIFTVKIMKNTSEDLMQMECKWSV